MVCERRAAWKDPDVIEGRNCADELVKLDRKLNVEASKVNLHAEFMHGLVEMEKDKRVTS